MLDPDDKITADKALLRISIVVAMEKLKLKEDEAGNKVTDVKGIRAACKVMKTDINVHMVQVKIP